MTFTALSSANTWNRSDPLVICLPKKCTKEFDTIGAIHARSIFTDHGGKILPDRRLDIFQRYEMNNAFVFDNRLQEYRGCKQFEVTYLRSEKISTN